MPRFQRSSERSNNAHQSVRSSDKPVFAVLLLHQSKQPLRRLQPYQSLFLSKGSRKSLLFCCRRPLFADRDAGFHSSSVAASSCIVDPACPRNDRRPGPRGHRSRRLFEGRTIAKGRGRGLEGQSRDERQQHERHPSYRWKYNEELVSVCPQTILLETPRAGAKNTDCAI